MSNRVEQLKARIGRLRISRKTLSERTGLDKATISRALNDHTDPRNSTLDKLEAAIEAEAAATAQYLTAGDAA